MLLSGGPYILHQNRRYEFNDDGSIDYRSGGDRFIPGFSRLHPDGSFVSVDTEVAMRVIRSAWANQRLPASKRRTIRTHCCKCTCKCPAAWGAKKKKNKHNGHESKAIDQATQVYIKRKDAAVQANITQETSGERRLFAGTRTDGSRYKRREDQSEPCHELVVPESSLSGLRYFLRQNADGHVLTKFDSDKQFQSKVLYKLHPLVHVERSPSIGKLMLKDFAEKLGLQHVEDTLKNSLDSNATKTRPRPLLTRNSRVDTSSSASQQKGHEDRPDKAAPPPPKGREARYVSKSKKLRVDRREDKENSANKFTPLEDAAIVRWVCVGGTSRERKVKGNQIWKQLQDEFAELSGQRRSWHSLRNRYLRYILPTLQRSGLVNAAVASRLRAHAAMGQASQTKQAPEAPRAVSAWTLRPRTPAASQKPTDPKSITASKSPAAPKSSSIPQLPIAKQGSHPRRRLLFNPRSLVH